MSSIEGDPTKPDAQPPSPGERVRREHVVVYQAGTVPPATATISPDGVPSVIATSPEGLAQGIEHAQKPKTLWDYVRVEIIPLFSHLKLHYKFLDSLEAYCELAWKKILLNNLTQDEEAELIKKRVATSRLADEKYKIIRARVEGLIERILQQRQPLQQPSG